MKQTNNTLTALDFAKDYLRRGWQPIPIPHRSKNPNSNGWQNFIFTEKDLPNHFNGKPQNIGILLGEKSNGLTDIDLDSPEAVKIADYFLPETKSEFGRAGKLRSHRLYYCKDAKFEKFNNPFLISSSDENERKRACIVELRTGNGKQTVFPSSTHESGELIQWQSNGEPFETDAQTLRTKIAQLASACLIATFWRNGIRNELNLALSGALLRNGFDIAETKHFIRAVGAAASDEEISDRLKAVDATAQKLERGEKVCGFPRFAELTDKKLVETVCKWLQIEKLRENNEKETRNDTEPRNGNSAFTFATLDELLSEPEETHSYLWENTLIFGGLSICSAKPKVGKSTIARNLAVAITQSETFLGRETVKGKVIYLCLEEKRSEIAKHFRLMGASGKDILIHTGATPNDALRALESAIADFEPSLVIIDPLARVLRVNDFNDYGTMSRGLEPFIDLARKTNVHILALHHEGKGDREGGDALLGSTALFGAVDCHLQMRKRNNGRTLSTTQRYGVDLPETVIELDKETGVIADKGDLHTFVLQEKKTDILNCITDIEKATEAEIKDRVGGNSKGIISKALRLLFDEKLLNREGDGKRNSPYLYSKNLENLENLEILTNDFTENEKPSNEADKQRENSENSVSRFLGFSNSENPENLENPRTAKRHCSKCNLELELLQDGSTWFCPFGCESQNVNARKEQGNSQISGN
jgi:hypothetical protein